MDATYRLLDESILTGILRWPSTIAQRQYLCTCKAFPCFLTPAAPPHTCQHAMGRRPCLQQHLRAMERGYLEQQQSGEDSVLGPTKPPASKSKHQPHTNSKNSNSNSNSAVRPPSTPGTASRRRAAGGAPSGGGKASAKRGKGGGGAGSGEEGGMPSASPGSPPIGFSPLPPKHVMVSGWGWCGLWYYLSRWLCPNDVAGAPWWQGRACVQIAKRTRSNFFA